MTSFAHKLAKSIIARVAIAGLIAASLAWISTTDNANALEGQFTSVTKQTRSTIDNFDAVIHGDYGQKMIAIKDYTVPVVSTDLGNTWTPVSNGVVRSWSLLAGSASLGKALAVAGNTFYLATTFGGAFSTIPSPSLTVTQWDSIAVNGAGTQLFAVAEDVLYWSSNNGTSWSSMTVSTNLEAFDSLRILSMVVSPEGVTNLSDQLLLGLSNGQVIQYDGFATDSPAVRASQQVFRIDPPLRTENNVDNLVAKVNGTDFQYIFAGSKRYEELKQISTTAGTMSSTAAQGGFSHSVKIMTILANSDLFIVSDFDCYQVVNPWLGTAAVRYTGIPKMDWIRASTATDNTSVARSFLQSDNGHTYISTNGIGNASGAMDNRIPKDGVIDFQESAFGQFAITSRYGAVERDGSNWKPITASATTSAGWQIVSASEDQSKVVYVANNGIILPITAARTEAVVRKPATGDWWDVDDVAISNDGLTVVVKGKVDDTKDGLWVSRNGGDTYSRIENARTNKYTDMHLDGSTLNLYVTSTTYGLEKFTVDGSNVWTSHVLVAPGEGVFDKFTVSPGEQQIIGGKANGNAYYATESGLQLIEDLGKHSWTDFQIATVGSTGWTAATSEDGQIQIKKGANGDWSTAVYGVNVGGISLGSRVGFWAQLSRDAYTFDLYLADTSWDYAVNGAFYPDNTYPADAFTFGLFDDDNEINNFSHYSRSNLTNDQYLCTSIGIDPCTVTQLSAPDNFLNGKLTLDKCVLATDVMCIDGVKIYEAGTSPTDATWTNFDVGTPTFAAQPTYGLVAGGKTSVWTSTWKHGGQVAGGASDGTQYAVNATVSFEWDAATSKVAYKTMVASVTPFNDVTSEGYVANTVTQQTNNGHPTVGYSMEAPSGRCVIVKTDYCGRIQDFASNTQVQVSVRVPSEIGGWYKGRMTDPTITATAIAAAPGNQLITVSAKYADVPRLQSELDATTFLSTLTARGQAATATEMSAHAINGSGIGIAASSSWSVAIIKALLQSPEVIANKANGFNTVWSFGTMSSALSTNACAAATGGVSVLGIIATDAMSYSDFGPMLDPTTGTLDYQVAGAHFKKDGSTVVTGNYQMSLNLDLAKCQFLLTDAQLDPTALANAVSVVDANGVAKTGVTTSVTANADWLTFKAGGITFSEPKIKVQLKPAAVSSGGGTAPIVTKPAPVVNKKLPAALKLPKFIQRGRTAKIWIPQETRSISGVKLAISQTAKARNACLATPVKSAGKVIALSVKGISKSASGCSFSVSTTVPESNTTVKSGNKKYVIPIK